MTEPKIKPQLKLLVLNYLGKCGGNKVQSAIEAGYSPTYAKKQSYKLFARKDVQEYMAYIQTKEGSVAKGIMELEGIQEWWSDVMRDGGARYADRIRASELLAKSKGAFKDEWS
ncbi:MAG: terminase small subunit [Lachnospiraceae bacterium]|nr:terminase small subunit [Lachnospiraceae bacterium]